MLKLFNHGTLWSDHVFVCGRTIILNTSNHSNFGKVKGTSELYVRYWPAMRASRLKHFQVLIDERLMNF